VGSGCSALRDLGMITEIEKSVCALHHIMCCIAVSSDKDFEESPLFLPRGTKIKTILRMAWYRMFLRKRILFILS
jgi:hypothetical protein